MEQKAWVITAHMGLGHMRAAWTLKNWAKEEKVIVLGDDNAFSTENDRKILNRTRFFYYQISRAMELPVIGKFIFGLLNKMMKFPGLYSKEDEKERTLGTVILERMVKKKKICCKISEKASCDKSVPLIHTFYATAVAMDSMCESGSNWLIVTDTDINRVWVAGNPEKSKIKYLVPCGKTERRLLKYGVKNENIFVSGFPLPIENIGSKEKQEIIAKDLAARMVRLDRNGSFRKMFGKTCLEILGLEGFPETEKTINLMYAIGGSGVQASTALKIAASLQKEIKNKDFSLTISCGINKELYCNLRHSFANSQYEELLGFGVNIIFANKFEDYYNSFNQALRKTDILWTKPSEMSFYCALGIPIITSAPVGHHEKVNRRWLNEIHAAIRTPGKAKECSEWLQDLIDTGILPQTAWNGYLNAEKMGTYNIIDKVFENIGKTK
jgi:hypothetical protein